MTVLRSLLCFQMSALFGTTTRATSKNLVEFRAGKMSIADKRVTPDARKGTVYVYQSEDGLMHFCWKDRKSGVVEDVSTLSLMTMWW